VKFGKSLCYNMDTMEDLQKKKKQQFIRVVLTEILMAMSVLCLTAFLTLLVLGYSIGDGWKIERSGLVQINSTPTGAVVTIDGEEELLTRTNLSKSYSSGLHKVVLSKDGYDTWEKEINVTEGYYYRLKYPRLFLTEKTDRVIGDLSKYNILAKSPNNNSLLALDRTEGLKFSLINLNGEKMTITSVDGTSIFRGGKEAAIEFYEWSASGEKVLVRSSYDEKVEWVLVDLKNIEETVNLTTTFGVDFEKIRFENGSASRVLAIIDGNLREINIGENELSKVLVAGVSDFTNNGEEIIYLTKANEEGERRVGVYKEGEKSGTKLYTVKNPKAVVKMAVGTYYEDDFLGIAVDDEMMIYQGTLPSYGESAKQMSLVIEKQLDFVVQEMKIKGDGELIFARNGAKVAVMDAEAFDVISYEMEDENAKWLDDFMLYSVKGGNITVWDFDGINKRVLVETNAAIQNNVMMTGNGKWLYYLDAESQLVAVKIG